MSLILSKSVCNGRISCHVCAGISLRVLPCFTLFSVVSSDLLRCIWIDFIAIFGSRWVLFGRRPFGLRSQLCPWIFLGTDSFKKENLFADSWNLSEDSGLFLHFCTGDLPISVMFEVFQSLVYTVYLQLDSCRPDERPCLSCDASQPKNLSKLL